MHQSVFSASFTPNLLLMEACEHWTKTYFCQMKPFPFSKQIFWDVDINTLDYSEKKRFVIERVLVRGGMTDVKVLFKVYNNVEIVAAIKQSKDLDDITHSFCANYFNIPKEEMNAPSKYY